MCEVVAASGSDRDGRSILASIAITFAPKAATQHTLRTLHTPYYFTTLVKISPSKAPVSLLVGAGAWLFAPVIYWLLADIDRQYANIGAVILFVIGFSFLTFGLFRRLSRKRTLYLAGTGALLLVLFFLCFEFRGFTGELVPTFRWRFAPPPIAITSQITTEDSEEEGPIGLMARGVSFKQFLGDDRSGVVTANELDMDWETSPPTLLWKIPIGEGWSGMSVAQGKVWTLFQAGDEEVVGCYALTTGKELWRRSFPGRHAEPLGGVGPRSTPTWHNGKVFVQTGCGIAASLEGATGEVLWQVDLIKLGFESQKSSESAIQWGRSGSPLIANHEGRDLVILPRGGRPGASKPISLIALNGETGEEVWSGGETQISYASPTLIEFDGMTQVVSVNEGNVSGHDLGSGALLWKEDWPSRSNADACASQPVPLGDGYVLLGKGYAAGSKLIRVTRGSEGEGKWNVETVWKNARVLKTKLTSAIYADGKLFGLNDGILECIEPMTGERVWRAGRYGQGQVLVVNHQLLVTSEGGMLILVDAKSGKKRFEQQVLDGVCWNYPAVAGPFVLMRNGSEMACFLGRL